MQCKITEVTETKAELTSQEKETLSDSSSHKFRTCRERQLISLHAFFHVFFLYKITPKLLYQFCNWKLNFTGRSSDGQACTCWRKTQRVSTGFYCANMGSSVLVASSREEGGDQREATLSHCFRGWGQSTPSCASCKGSGIAEQELAPQSCSIVI